MKVHKDRLRNEIVRLLPQLRKFALSLSRNVQDADDLVQSAVVRALGSDLEPAARLENWMYTVVRNLWIDETRRRKVRGPAEPIDEQVALSGGDGRILTETRSDLARVLRAFHGLSTELRETAALVILNGLSYREAAEALSVPVGTVMSRVSRTREALHAALSGENGDGQP
jgi:RNA polymerase sigma-70 factor, ECF subfamily